MNKLFFSVVFVITVGVTNVQAAENCVSGESVSVKGDIDNNIVNVRNPNGLGLYTMGVARLGLKSERKSIKLHCALLGEPTGEQNPTVGHQYDHMIVCDDGQQSEIAFKTRFVAQDSTLTNVLTNEEIEDFCHTPYAVVAFKELAEVNGERLTKGVFQGASGQLIVAGCVNALGSGMEVNMSVKGDLCLPNW